MTGSFLQISEAASLGLHAMAILVREGNDPRVSTSFIAEALDVSEAHLSKVLQRLVRSGLLHSKRGPGGGFQLTRRAEAITLLEIYVAVEGDTGFDTCLLGGRSCRPSDCPLGTLKRNVDTMVRETLGSIRLSVFSDAPGGVAALKHMRNKET